jgi:hypothetical protein
MILWTTTAAFAEGKLLATDLYNDPNSVITFKGEDGVINYIQATFNPGDGYMCRFGIEVADDPAGIHGLGFVKSDRIEKTGPSSYIVNGYSTFPAKVQIEKDAIVLELGSETYRITKPSEYLVEVWPHGLDGKPDLTRRFAYRLDRNRSYGFIGIIDKSYIPDYSRPLRSDLDPDAIYYPQDFHFDGKTQTAYVYQIGGRESACFCYEYSFDFSKDPAVNLQNYLILLTQRRGDTLEYPMIHAVLLTIYFYEAMMP